MLIYKTMFSRLIYLIALIALCISLPCLARSQQSSKSEQDMKKYAEAVQKKVKSHWHPTLSKSSSKTKTELGFKFKIDKTGKAYDIKITLSSGSPDNDLLVIKAIKDASPFGPLPASISDMNPNYVEVECKIKPTS